MNDSQRFGFKVIFIVDGSVGKTSLINNLQGYNFQNRLIIVINIKNKK